MAECRSLAELQVSRVQAMLTKKAFDTSVKFSVHGLLVVDALQTLGHDYELLVASHKNLWYVVVTFFLFCVCSLDSIFCFHILLTVVFFLCFLVPHALLLYSYLFSIFNP